MQKLISFGGEGNSVRAVFAHANGYPPMSYRTLFEALATDIHLQYVEHRPLWDRSPAPRTLPWSSYADDLIATLSRSESEPVWLIGHSMGAVISLQVAQALPDRVCGVIAIDPVMLPRGQWLAAKLMMRLPWVRFALIDRALGRPHEFDDFQQAFDFYRGKRVFSDFSDEVLWHYVRAGHSPADGGGVSLRWSGAWEACVYRSGPLAWPLLKCQSRPVFGIVGDHSNVVSKSTYERWQAVNPGKVTRMVGSHLLPLEYPEKVAKQVLEYCRYDRTKPSAIM
jgi:pimeloyl-ACP methyl ester carboxylesterase